MECGVLEYCAKSELHSLLAEALRARPPFSVMVGALPYHIPVRRNFVPKDTNLAPRRKLLLQN
jgi:hypothetical protein